MLKKILFSFFALFLFSSLTKNIIEYKKNIDFYENYKKKFTEEKNTNNKLKADAIKSNDQFEVEKKIRNQLNLLKENETAVIVPLPTAAPTVVTPTPAPIYQQWVQVFVKN